MPGLSFLVQLRSEPLSVGPQEACLLFCSLVFSIYLVVLASIFFFFWFIFTYITSFLLTPPSIHVSRPCPRTRPACDVCDSIVSDTADDGAR